MSHVMDSNQRREPDCLTGTPLPVVQESLPIVEEAPRERADAARNRVKVLAAAEELFARHGPDCVSMEAIAAAAGVGKGTLFRRFGDRAGLARALLDERERRLQEAMIRGAPPLGPGAPPHERLVAFGRAILEFPDDHRAILVTADSGGARYRHPAYAAWHTHVALLLREGAPDLDADLMADFLLAALRAELVSHLRAAGTEPERIADAWETLVRRLVPG
jgi:AcrR family transcriptional regulator